MLLFGLFDINYLQMSHLFHSGTYWNIWNTWNTVEHFPLLSFRDVAKLHGGIFIFCDIKDFSGNFVTFEMTKAFHRSILEHTGTHGTEWNKQY